MSQIKKIDYYVGVFLSAILKSANTVPALFDETDKSKKIEFTTDTNKFNIYVKYSTNIKETPPTKNGEKKKETYWNITFTNSEYEKFANFKKANFLNYLVLVCTNESYSTTWLAVVDYELAMKCLKNSTQSEQRRIKVTRYGNDHEFFYSGVNFEDKDSRGYFDYKRYFI